MYYSIDWKNLVTKNWKWKGKKTKTFSQKHYLSDQ